MTPKDITGDNWKLTLPVGEKGKPKEYLFPEFSNLKNEYFFMKDNVLIFHAPCNGVTTKNSKYPRSELRELINSKLAAWDCKKGKHSMTYTVACNHLPKNKPQVVLGQIHDDKDDVVEIRLTGTHLEAMHDSTIFGTFLTTYTLGTFIEINITAENGVVSMTCEGKEISFKSSSKGCYFKVGCYVQSNASKGDENDYGEVSLSKLKVIHT